MAENTFPVSSAEAIVNFFKSEILNGQEAKHLTKSDLTPVPKVKLLHICDVRAIKAVYFLLESGFNVLFRQLRRNVVHMFFIFDCSHYRKETEIAFVICQTFIPNWTF